MLEIEKNTKKKLENETRIENLKELVNAMSEFTNLDEFLEHVGLVNENIKNTEKNNITLMTLHGAKGLEFDHVFIPYAEKITNWCKSYWEALHPYSSGGAYSNFMMDEGQERVMASYRHNYKRLSEIKKKHDPTNFFSVNQNIKPSG